MRGGRWEVDEEVEVDAVEYLLHLLHWSLGRSLGRRALSRGAPRPRPTPLRATPSAVILVVVVVVVMKEEVGVVEYLEHLQQFLLGAPLTPRRPNATHPALVEVVVVEVEVEVEVVVEVAVVPWAQEAAQARRPRGAPPREPPAPRLAPG